MTTVLTKIHCGGKACPSGIQVPLAVGKTGNPGLNHPMKFQLNTKKTIANPVQKA